MIFAYVKTMLVLWSGGCDSTLVLFDLCKQQKARQDSNNFGTGLIMHDHEKVRALSIFHDQLNENAKKMEAKARLKIFNEFKKRGFSFECLTVNIENMQGSTRGGCLQSAIWLLSAAPYLLEKEDLYTGYVKEDDIWHDRDALVRAFDGVQKLMDGSGAIRFPLEWETKHDIVDRLQKEKLLDLTWWCERPEKTKPCGTCKSCYRMDSTFYLHKLKCKREKVEKVVKK